MSACDVWPDGDKLPTHTSSGNSSLIEKDRSLCQLSIQDSASVMASWHGLVGTGLLGSAWQWEAAPHMMTGRFSRIGLPLIIISNSCQDLYKKSALWWTAQWVDGLVDHHVSHHKERTRKQAPHVGSKPGRWWADSWSERSRALSLEAIQLNHYGEPVTHSQQLRTRISEGVACCVVGWSQG